MGWLGRCSRGQGSARGGAALRWFWVVFLGAPLHSELLGVVKGLQD